MEEAGLLGLPVGRIALEHPGAVEELPCLLGPEEGYIRLFDDEKTKYRAFSYIP